MLGLRSMELCMALRGFLAFLRLTVETDRRKLGVVSRDDVLDVKYFSAGG
jgi:hypothetical protein